MDRHFLIIGSLLLIGTAAARAQPQAAVADPTAVTADAVDDAIAKAVRWIEKQRNEHGHFESGDTPDARYWAGDSALAMLALLYAGVEPRGGEMQRGLQWLAEQKLQATYVFGLRAHVLALVPGTEFRRQLDGDLEWIVESGWPRGSKHAGAYDYVAVEQDRQSGWYDNSNSQFAVLGAWMAAEAGVRNPALNRWWDVVEAHWLKEQNADGGWGYQDHKESTGSMTAAALATLYVVLDFNHAGATHKRAAEVRQALERGLGWLSREFTTDNPGSGQWKHYYLYAVERAGRASGRKYFQGRDWFRLGAAELLRTQAQDGSWGDLRDTSFALMFLAHGRAPLMLNKLEYSGDWNTQYRDAATLAHYGEQSLERLLNWQIVSLSGTVDDLLEAPLLYLTGTQPVELNDAEVSKLREYLERGGLLVAVPAGDASRPFLESVEKLTQSMYPELPLRPVPADHPLLSGAAQFKLETAPVMLMQHNGVRPLAILIDRNIAEAWNRNLKSEAAQRDFQLGVNLYVFATDKTTVNNRLRTSTMARREVDILKTLEVARLRYSGNWDVEPYGWSRLSQYLNNEINARLQVTNGVRIDELHPREFRVAYMTGTGAFELTDDERAGLRRFLTGGGTLIADAACGSGAFLESFERELAGVMNGQPRLVPEDDPVITGAGLEDGVKLTEIGFRRAARRTAIGRAGPPLKAFELGRRYAVVYSPLDVSAGLLGTPVFGCVGYDAASSLKIMRNLLLYANLNTAEKARLGRRD